MTDGIPQVWVRNSFEGLDAFLLIKHADFNNSHYPQSYIAKAEVTTGAYPGECTNGFNTVEDAFTMFIQLTGRQDYVLCSSGSGSGACYWIEANGKVVIAQAA